MYKILNSLALCAIIGTTCAIAAPQDPQTQNGSKQQVNREARVEERLALTADQRTQFRAIVQNRHDQVMSIRNDASLSSSERREKMKAVRLDADAKVRAMLNQNQIAEYDQILKERHAHERANRKSQTAPLPQQ
jgi:hypothetical protein